MTSPNQISVELPLSVTEIQKYLPHRYPFLMIDRVTELDPMKRIVALKNVTVNEELFNGHFPQFPVFPGVMIVEAMAQACGILGFVSNDKTPADGSVYLFAGIDDVRFKRQVQPGDQLVFECEYVSHRRGIWKFTCKASVDGKLVTSANIMCADRPL